MKRSQNDARGWKSWSLLFGLHRIKQLVQLRLRDAAAPTKPCTFSYTSRPRAACADKTPLPDQLYRFELEPGVSHGGVTSVAGELYKRWLLSTRKCNIEPWLEAQHAGYLTKQLKDFKSDIRGNDKAMAEVARRLSDDDIEKVAGFLAAIPRPPGKH